MMNDNQWLNSYADKNQQYFFEELFYGNKEQKAALAKEVIRLCDLFPSQFRDDFDEIQQLSSIATRYLNEKSVALSAVHNSLKEKKLITKCKIAAFVASELTLTSYNKTKFDHYKAVTLIVIMRLSLRGEHKSKVDSICNEIRQYSLGYRERLSSYLPSLKQSSFLELIEYFEEITDDDSIENTPISRCLNKYKVPYRDSYYGNEGIHRKSGTREFKRSGTLSIKPKIMFDNDTSLLEVKELSLQSSQKNQAWENEEEQAAVSRTLSLVSSSKFATKDKFINVLQAQAINQHIRKRSMDLTCDVQSLTIDHVKCIINDSSQAIQHSSEHSDAAKVILLMLITGSAFDNIKKWKAEKSQKTGSIIGVRREFILPTQKIREELQDIMPKIIQNYVLPLPLNILTGLKNFRFKHLSMSDIAEFLSIINKRHEISVSLTKVSSFLVKTMKKNGIDISLIELISGHDPQNQPARFYTSVSPQRLHSTYLRYLKYLTKISDNDFLSDTAEVMSSNASLGSPFYFPNALLTQLLLQLKQLSTTYQTKDKFYFSEQTHNLKVLYLQLILGLSSGYRPVEGWFGTLNDIHTSTGEYRIAEKERAVGYRGRVVRLPLVAIEAIETYKKYCNHALMYFSNTSPSLFARYEQVLNGELPFCFYRYHDSYEETLPSTYMRHIDPIFPLPANWTRHYIRSFLFDNNIPDELIAAWLGHSHGNQLPFEQYSQLKRKDLIIIRDLLHSHIKMLIQGETHE
ncbi:hypothetical protein [Aliivibrio sp. SR45-2]|jgi:hypothetical protein|uniref:hypothetical protein n=1 Tax=Aliivibrio sp. SR45-2 TaxID=2760931 RepID=UPI0015FA69FA|nr:hypothetical protein [Aliivibrio sp. SR45-2]MBB1314179.1 hypothetical protein [Aliivibrio sp. SR45-2]